MNEKNAYSTADDIFGGFIVGVIFIIIAFPIMWNNERKQVKVEALIKQGQKKCQNVQDQNNPEATQNFALVYASGISRNEELLKDEEF